jgi:hypothetical protein
VLHAPTQCRSAPSPSSHFRNGRPTKLHRAINGGRRCAVATASGAPSSPFQALYKAARTPLQPAPLPRAPPLQYTAAPKETEPELRPRCRSPPPTPLLPLQADR